MCQVVIFILGALHRWSRLRYTSWRMAQDIVEELKTRVSDGRETVRGVARKIVGEQATKSQIESKRRHLVKILDGTKPQPPTVRQIAIALELDPAGYVEAKPAPAPSTRQEVARISREMEELAGRLDALAGSGAAAGQSARLAPTVLPAGLEGSVAHLLEWQKEVIADLGALDRRLEQLETRQAGEAGQAEEGTGS